MLKKPIVAMLFMSVLACAPKKQEAAQSPESATTAPTQASTEFFTCPEERPEICTKEYRPVCGQVDTGVRCVTTPCPSTTEQTFGNACTACAEPKVLGYTDGACAK